MIIHSYLFLSMLFVGLQGTALFRHQIKKLSENKTVSVVNNLKKQINKEFIPLWVKSEESVTKSEVEEVSNLRDPSEISDEIFEEIKKAFPENENTESEIIADNSSTEEEVLTENENDIDTFIAANKENKISTDENKDAIVVFDYVKAQNSAPKVTTLDNNKNTTKRNVNDYLKKRKPSESSFLDAQSDQRVANQTPLYYEGEFKFQLPTDINVTKIELRSLYNDEEVSFDSSGYGYIVKNFTFSEATEDFQANYPMSMPVNMKAYWQDGVNYVNEVPIIDQIFINNLYRRFQIKGEWGLILTKIKEDIDYINVDEQKALVFLDNNLEETDEKNAGYVLYLGVPIGSQDLKFIVNGVTMNYPVYITENEISYIDLKINTNKISKNFSIFEKLPLGKENKDLFLDKNQVAAITSDAYLEKEGLNNFKFNSNQSIVGIKESVVLNVGGQNYFTDVKKINTDIIIPSSEYINQILDTADDASISCIIEIIPSRKVEYVKAKVLAKNVENSQGKEIHYTTTEAVIERYLDADGIFYPTHSTNSKKIFILAEDNGLVLVKINFKDGTEANYEYFCESKDYHLDPTGE